MIDSTNRENDQLANCGKIFFATFWVWLHCFFTRSPVCGAHFVRIGLDVLEGLQHTKGLINIATNGQVVDGGMHDYTIRIDDEQATQGNTLCVIKNVVSGRNFFLQSDTKG